MSEIGDSLPVKVKPEAQRAHSHPALDEATFQQLLSAAYVMQEHNARLRKAQKPGQNSELELPPRKQPGTAHAKSGVQHDSTPPLAATPTTRVTPPVPPATRPEPVLGADICHSCGVELAANESFCGRCGALRKPAGALQKTWASLWDRYEEEGPTPEPKKEDASSTITDIKALAEAEDIALFPPELEDILGKFEEVETDAEVKAKPAIAEPISAPVVIAKQPVEAAVETTALTTGHTSGWASPWASAAKARQWLESVKDQRPDKDSVSRFWQIHRSHIYLAVAAAVLLMVVLDITPQAPDVPGEAQQLSAFERMLVSLGVAEAPPPPQVLHGNPNTKVWIDMKTALYYCPGADLYGKTEAGKFMSQIDAQRDQFEPSTRRACN